MTCAWPPSLPSVPTSRATRVTSDVNTESCSIIVLTSFAERRNSPLRARPSASSSIDCPRSPLATAPIVRAISAVGRTRSSISVLMDSTFVAHWPIAPGSDMRCFSRPSLPTVTLKRSTSRVMSVLMGDGLVERLGDPPFGSAQSDGRRHEKSPSRNAIIAASSICERLSELPGDESGILFRLWRGFPLPMADREVTRTLRTVASLIVHPSRNREAAGRLNGNNRRRPRSAIERGQSSGRRRLVHLRKVGKRACDGRTDPEPHRIGVRGLGQSSGDD